MPHNPDWDAQAAALEERIESLRASENADPAELQALLDRREHAVPWSPLVATLGELGPRDWFAEGAIEGAPIVVLSGPEKSHKSWAAIHAAVSATHAGHWLGRWRITSASNPVYLDGEYGRFEFTRRVARVARGEGLDPLAVCSSIRHLYSADLALDPADTLFKKLLRDLAADPPNLIVLDPLKNHLAGDENDSKIVLAAFKAIGKLRDAASCPVLVIHHLNKSGLVAGSRTVATRADLLIDGTDGEIPEYTTRGRTLRRGDSIAAPFTIAIDHVHDEDDSRAETILTASPLPEATKLPKTQQKVLDVLRSSLEPRTANYVRAAAKTSGEACGRALQALVDAGLAVVVPEGCEWNGRRTDGYAAVSGEDSE